MANDVSANGAPADETTANDSPVTREEFAALTKQMQAQSRYLAKLEKQLSGKAQPENVSHAESSSNENMPGLREQLAQIQREQEQLKGERERVARAKIAATISRTLQKRGVPAALADDASEVHLARMRDRFQISDMDEVTYVHNGEELSLDSYCQSWLATEKGSCYLAPKNGPSRVSLPNGRPATGRKVTITREQLSTGNYDPSLKPSEIVVAD